MPEIRFQIQWPDGTFDTCYSPSLVVQDYFEAGQSYELSDFIQRSNDALNIAIDRVNAKFGYPCGLAIGQLEMLNAKAKNYENIKSPEVKVTRWIQA